jgi:hypothetical protein
VDADGVRKSVRETRRSKGGAGGCDVRANVEAVGRGAQQEQD